MVFKFIDILKLFKYKNHQKINKFARSVNFLTSSFQYYVKLEGTVR